METRVAALVYNMCTLLPPTAKGLCSSYITELDCKSLPKGIYFDWIVRYVEHVCISELDELVIEADNCNVIISKGNKGYIPWKLQGVYTVRCIHSCRFICTRIL